MGVVWGSWDESGGNGIRVGIDVDWEDVSHSEGGATATVIIWTENRFSYSDSQALNYSGHLDNNDEGRSSKSFTNSQGGSPEERDEVHYTYTYGSTQYGSSPGTRTFTASLSGAFNGVTPSVSVTTPIPARPYDTANPPTNVSASRVTDAATTVAWTNNATAGEPWDTILIQRSVNGAAYATVTGSLGGSATSYSASTWANTKFRFAVRAQNSVGVSAFAISNDILTTPSAPTGVTRTGANGANQVITWTNTAGYQSGADWATEIYRSTNNGTYGYIGIVNGDAGVNNSFTDTYPATHPTDKFKYIALHRTRTGTQGTRWSVNSNVTSETTGVTSAPAAPTLLNPSGAVVDPLRALTFTWKHNATDTSAQTKYQLRHRLVGAGTWTTTAVTTSAVSGYTMPANTYASGSTVEWQVATYGADAAQGAWSASAQIDFITVKWIPLLMDLYSGALQVDSNHDTGWINVTYQGTWTSYGSGFAPAQYRRIGKEVHIRGLVKSGAVGSANPIFTLPSGYRPEYNEIYPGITFSMTTGAASAGTAHTHDTVNTGCRVNVYTTGAISVEGLVSNAFVSLSGIKFLLPD